MATPPLRTTSHPLEMVPLLRSWRPSIVRDVLYTAIFNALLALLQVMISRFLNERDTTFLQDFLPSLLIANLIGYLIHASLVASDRVLGAWLARLALAPRMLYLVSVVTLCAMLGVSLGVSLLRGVHPLDFLTSTGSAGYMLRSGLVAGCFMLIVFIACERRIASETLAARHREQVETAARLLAEARLRALQAQIEPHFLYNTLANVLGMIDTNPAQARHMLERFIDYLRASLAASRADTSTLGTELDLAAAYLDVLAVRMGARLRYRFEVEPACRALPIAPMLLHPLIENAVAHGLEPKVDGGDIVVRVTREAATLRIEVADTGVGLRATPAKPGGGVGLSNLRARLRSSHGAAAQLQMLENETQGITMRLTLPVQS